MIIRSYLGVGMIKKMYVVFDVVLCSSGKEERTHELRTLIEYLHGVRSSLATYIR